jgi:hypothetical protein
VRYLVVTKTKNPAVQEEPLLRGPLAEDDFLRTAIGVLRARAGYFLRPHRAP